MGKRYQYNEKLKTRYVLVTPLKNEEKTIASVINSVVNQEFKPYLWVIVNDGSTDRSEDIIKEKIKSYKWIKLISKTINKEYNWLGYSKVIVEAVNFLLEEDFFKRNRIDFWGILDSDITIDSNYFSRLMQFLQRNKDIGVVSGGIYILKDGRWELEYKSKDPRGGARLYQMDAFKAIGYFPNTPSPDRVSDIKILARGYKTASLNNIKAYQHRKSFERNNSLLGAHFKHGRSRYILSFATLHVLLTSVQLSFKKRPLLLSGIAYLWGYVSGFLSGEERISDIDVINHSRHFWKRLVKHE